MRILCIAFLAAFILSCNSKKIDKEYCLTSQEIKYCDSVSIDTSVVALIKQFTDSKIELFHYSLSKELHPDGTEKELDPIYLKGVVFQETVENANLIIDELYKKFKDKGYTIFTLESNFGIGNKKDVLGILKTTDKYEILKGIRTNGANYDINPDSLIQIIKVLDQKYSLDLIGASGDWCEFVINKDKVDWSEFAKEAYRVCPDIVEQGTGTVEALEEDLKKRRKLYFWWD